MSVPRDLTDDVQLFEALSEAFDEEPPDDVTQFALEAFEWVAMDLELAQLTASVDVAIRGPEGETFLPFSFANGTIELLVGSDHVIGQVQPEHRYDITITGTDARALHLSTDLLGRFRADISTPFSIEVRGADVSVMAVVTPADVALGPPPTGTEV